MNLVTLPGYSRGDLTVGIAHFGVGNFHRAHQAVFLSRLFDDGLARDWAICGIGVLPGDLRMRDALASTDYEYTQVERRPDGTSSARSIRSIVDFLHAPDDPEAVIALLARPATRIVSLTITEGGYNTNSVTGRFDDTAPAIVADLARGAVPATVFGLVVEALARRRASGVEPFTVMSCDNLQGNGAVARAAFVAFASLRDAELGAWIQDHVRFPNSMVDRITPATLDDDRQSIAAQFGATDPWPVVSESYLQWVLEDSFTLGRPPLDLVGVDLVGDVAPYEKMKLRLLNASHQALAYFGLLLGYRYVHEAAADPLIARLLERYLAEEAIPTLDPIPGYDVEGYAAAALERFRNPAIRDTLARIATDASDRVPTFLVPVAVDRAARGSSAPLAAAVIASWAAAAQQDICPEDRQSALVNAALQLQAERPAGFLEEARLFGDLAHAREFAAAFAFTHELISSVGSREALESVVFTE